LEEYLAGLRLNLHPDKTRLKETNIGMNFLGFRILPYRLRVLNDNLHKDRRQLRELTDDYAKGKALKEKFQQFVQRWFADLDHGDTWRIRQQMLADLYWYGIDLDLLKKFFAAQH
jgi:retron-type reverse transcriptase